MIWIILGVVAVIFILGSIDNKLNAGSGDSDDGWDGDYDGAGGGGKE